MHKRGTSTVIYKCYTHIWGYLKGRPKVKHKMKLKIRAAVMTPESFGNFNSADFGSATSFVTVDPNCISIDFNKQQQSRFEWLVIVCCALLLWLSLAFRVHNSWTGIYCPLQLVHPLNSIRVFIESRTRLPVLETNVLLSFGKRICFKPR